MSLNSIIKFSNEEQTMYYGIYNFCFNHKIINKDFILHPFYENYNDVKNVSNETGFYNLTGFLECYCDSNEKIKELIFNLSAVLTFIQQQNVIITNTFDSFQTDKTDLKRFRDYIVTEKRNWSQFFFRNNKDFDGAINKVYEKVISDNDPCNTKSKDFFDDNYHKEYASLIFKNIEKFKMSEPFVEITYFLDFSALESFCKAYIKNVLKETVCNDVNSNIAKVLNALKIPFVCSGCSEKFEMNKYDKDSKTNEKEFFKSSIRTYTGLRNALFHSNKFFEYFDEEGKYSSNNSDPKHLIFKHKIKVTDCCYNLHKLVMYVGLKYAGFNSEIYNWSSWWKRTPA